MENTYIPCLLDGWATVSAKGVFHIGGCLVLQMIYKRSMKLHVFWAGVSSALSFCLTMSKWLLHEPSRRSETGEYLALDLGGTNFRVLLITLKDGRMVDQVHFD